MEDAPADGDGAFDWADGTDLRFAFFVTAAAAAMTTMT